MITGIFKNYFLCFFTSLFFNSAISYAQIISKINGVNFTAPPTIINADWTKPVVNIRAGWVAIIPFAFIKGNEPNVYFDYKWQWWGETSAGVSQTIQHAKASGLKVMIKPQIWVQHGEWIGSFDAGSEKNWLIWEKDYREYLLTYAKIAAKENAEMLCIGTEIRIAVKKRPLYWRNLISEIKKIYQGKLTYSSNWDDYKEVSFWNDLDYVGISAYFPLVDKDSPDLKELGKAWNPIVSEMSAYSANCKKQILFTEYGYRSMNKPAWKSWEQEYKEGVQVNTAAQVRAYQALFAACWNQNWMAGGFLWKWYHDYSNVGGAQDTDWTPQNKPAEKVIQSWYQRTTGK